MEGRCSVSPDVVLFGYENIYTWHALEISQNAVHRTEPAGHFTRLDQCRALDMGPEIETTGGQEKPFPEYADAPRRTD